MNLMNDIADRLKSVFMKTFSLTAEQLPDRLEQEFIEQWDSLGHLQLIMAIEQEFGLRFNSEKIPKLTSLAKIIEEIPYASQL